MSPPSQRLGLGTLFGLLVLGRVLLALTVLVFVAITIAAHGVDYGSALRTVATDPLPLGAAQLAALSAVLALGLWLGTPGVPPARALGITPTPRRWLAVAALVGLGLQLPMVEVITLLTRVLPVLAHPPAIDEMTTALTRIDTPLRAFTVPFTFVVIAPVTEELLFRGLVLRTLRDAHGRGAAIALSALLFGAYHLDLQALVFATFVGLLLGWVADRAGSTMPGIALHAGFNALPVLFPEAIVRIPGFNTESGDDVPLAWVLGSAALALVAFAVLARMLTQARAGDHTS